jgi:hypothetical protein
MSIRARWIVVAVAAIIGLSSCIDRHSGLRARLAKFPAPPDLVLIDEEETGPSSCVNGDCPTVARFYLTEQTLDITCRSVRRAVDGWVFESVDWSMEADAFNACSGHVAGLSVSVFDADRLPAVSSAEIDPFELRRYRSAVLISLTAL